MVRVREKGAMKSLKVCFVEGRPAQERSKQMLLENITTPPPFSFIVAPNWHTEGSYLFHFTMLFVVFQINELSHVTIPVMLLPDDFKAYSKLKVDNHLFNK